MNANNNDWTTVRGGNPKTNSAFGSRTNNESRSMPSAFGGGRQAAASPAAERYREYNRMNAEAEAALASKAAREKRETAERERAAERDALALTSETSYPSLGGGAAAAKPTTKPVMNYGRVVAERAALDKLEAEARELAAAAAATSSSFDWAPTGLSLGAAKRRALIGTRCFDDGPEDYDGPEEDFGDNDVGNDSDYEDEAPPEDDTAGEFNADLGATRRRGDKNSLY